MDEIVLKFQFVDCEVSLMIDDADKVMWIDLINEYEDECVKKKHLMPEFPTFCYCFGQKSVYIDSDKDLMTMLERLCNSKVIYIYVGYGKKPSDSFAVARKLKASIASGSGSKNVFYGKSPPSKEVVEPQTVQFEAESSHPKHVDEPIVDLGVDQDQMSSLNQVDHDIYDRLNQCNEQTYQDVMTYLDENPHLKKALNKKLPVKKKTTTSTKDTKSNKSNTQKKKPSKKTSNAPIEPPVKSQFSSFLNAPTIDESSQATLPPTLPPNSAIFLKKIPATTAARKGITQPKLPEPIEDEYDSEQLIVADSTVDVVAREEPINQQGEVHGDEENDDWFEENTGKLALGFEEYDPHEYEHWNKYVDCDESTIELGLTLNFQPSNLLS